MAQESLQERVVQDWAQEYLKEEESAEPRLPKLKIGDGEQVELSFCDNGVEIPSPEYGPAIMFTVKVKELLMVWFVSKKKYTILTAIARAKPIVGRSALVTRIGKGKADTRWSIKFKEAVPVA